MPASHRPTAVCPPVRTCISRHSKHLLRRRFKTTRRTTNNNTARNFDFQFSGVVVMLCGGLVLQYHTGSVFLHVVVCLFVCFRKRQERRETQGCRLERRLKKVSETKHKRNHHLYPWFQNGCLPATIAIIIRFGNPYRHTLHRVLVWRRRNIMHGAVVWRSFGAVSECCQIREVRLLLG
jgi:hypothetical protein